MSEHLDLYDAAYILWINDHAEGWKPYGCDSIAECYDQAIQYTASDFVITKAPIRVAFIEARASVREGNHT